MADPRFYDNTGPLTLAQIAEIADARVVDGDARQQIFDIAALDAAGPNQLTYCEGVKFKSVLESTRAGAALVPEALASSVPTSCTALICAKPQLGFARVSHAFYPDPAQFWPASKPPVLPVATSARVGEGTILCPNVFLGEDVEIGRDCVVGPGTVIGRGVKIGNRSKIGAHVSISHALIGDRCIIHGGARIGQDGFGYIGSAAGHFKIPQLGRVIIQDDVEIGANTAVDRGALADTIIGEGSKIDNLVQIAHNTRLGRHVVLAAQVGFSGSVTVGDFAVLAGQVGVADHLTIGPGATVAAKAGVTRTLEGGRVHGGFPAKPVEQWRREVAALSRLAKGKRSRNERDGSQD